MVEATDYTSGRSSPLPSTLGEAKELGPCNDHYDNDGDPVVHMRIQPEVRTDTTNTVEGAGSLWIATVNTQGLAEKTAELLGLAKLHNIDVVCVQEANVLALSFDAVRRLAASEGYQVFFHVNDPAQQRAQLCIFSRVHITEFMPTCEDVDTPWRLQWVLVHRTGQQPLLLGNIYGNASNPTARDNLICRGAQIARLCAQDWMIMGDYNCTSHEGGVARI